ncbi:MAG: energy transducer TonB [Polaribacter sp.]|nr:energy transducer TonB [Polaribacter sp.]
MLVREVKHKRASAIITAVILLLFIFVICNFGMRYLDPPEEYGLAVNVGSSEVGNRMPVQKNKKNSTSNLVQKKALVKEEVVEAPKEVLREVSKESLLTDDAVKEVPTVEKETEEEDPMVAEIVQKKKSTPPKVAKATQDALRSLLEGASATESSDEEGGIDNPGVKGSDKGDATSLESQGNSATGLNMNYNLAGRKVLSTPKEQPDCQEEGRVVVRVQVDNNGNVIAALAGVKGTTNSAPCLLKPAKEAALRTQWNADLAAPSKQVGTIIYTFSLIK